MAILEVEHIKKKFGKTDVLKDISFSLEQGEVELDGVIESMVYTGSRPAKMGSVLKRLFR